MIDQFSSDKAMDDIGGQHYILDKLTSKGMPGGTSLGGSKVKQSIKYCKILT